MKAFTFVTLVIFYTTTCSSAVLFPPNFPRCKRYTEEVDKARFIQCFKDASEKARPFMKEGLKEVGIPSLTKVVVPSITIEQNSRVTSFSCVLRNITVYGLDGYKILDIDVASNWSSSGTVLLPSLILDGKYEITGRILNENITQSGFFNATLSNSTAETKLEVEFVKKKGVEYGKIISFEVDPVIGGATAHFDNLFGDNDVLNKVANAFLEESLDILIESTKPEIRKLIDSLMNQMAKAIIGNLPWDNIFPSS